MCYHGKCFLCIPVETGSFVCAIIIAVLTALTLLISFILGCLTATGAIFGIYVSYTTYNPYNSNAVSSRHVYPNGGVAVAFYLLAVTALVGLVFAVLLCSGISKRHPGYIKAYFIYGVVLTGVTVVVAVGMLLGGFQIVSVFLLVACVIYSLFLVLVQKAYFKILEGGDNGTVLKQNELFE